MHRIDRSKQIYTFVEEYLKHHQRPPTLREIMTELRISSTSVVSRQLQIMEDEGMIIRDPFTARGIRLL